MGQQVAGSIVFLVCNRCDEKVRVLNGKSPSSKWRQDKKGKVEFGDGTKGLKDQWWHKCYEESLAPGWAPASESCECGGRLIGKEEITSLTDDNVMSWHRLWADISQEVEKGAKFCEKCHRVYPLK